MTTLKTIAARLLGYLSNGAFIAAAVLAIRVVWLMFADTIPDHLYLNTFAFLAISAAAGSVANRLAPDPDEPRLPVRPEWQSRVTTAQRCANITGLTLIVTGLSALVRQDTLGYAMAAVGVFAAVVTGAVAALARDLLVVHPDDEVGETP